MLYIQIGLRLPVRHNGSTTVSPLLNCKLWLWPMALPFRPFEWLKGCNKFYDINSNILLWQHAVTYVKDTISVQTRIPSGQAMA